MRSSRGERVGRDGAGRLSLRLDLAPALRVRPGTGGCDAAREVIVSASFRGRTVSELANGTFMPGACCDAIVSDVADSVSVMADGPGGGSAALRLNAVSRQQRMTVTMTRRAMSRIRPRRSPAVMRGEVMVIIK